MRLENILRAIALLPALLGVASAVACTNVTISSSDDADEVRRDCKIIKGDLTFAPDLAESISLDGVEVVEGSILHNGCEDDHQDCPSLTPFEIWSSTITTVNGSIEFWYFNGLQELDFSGLTLVQNGFNLKRMHYLKALDISSLTRVGFLIIEAPKLMTLRHEKLEGFTGEDGEGSVAFWSAGVDSVDSFYSAPIRLAGNSEQSRLSFSSYDLPNVRRLTIGWAKVEVVSITGGGLNVTFGAKNTTSIEIGSLELHGNLTDIKRASSLKNLSIGDFTFDDSRTTTEIDLDFDQASSLSITGNFDLHTIKLPPAALNWRDFTLDISQCPNLTLDSQYRNSSDNSSQEQIWYWPQQDMQSIFITGVPVSDKFFESFLQYNAEGSNLTNPPKVLQSFDIAPSDALSFNCTPFNELHDRGVLPADYNCTDVTSSAARGLAAHTFRLPAMALLVIYLVLA